MHYLPQELRGAVTGFVILLCKGLIEDRRWNWNRDQCDWDQYQSGFTDPGVLRTALSVFLNTLQIDKDEIVLNYQDARFRGFQYFRALIDPSYPISTFESPFQSDETKEPPWYIWEA